MLAPLPRRLGGGAVFFGEGVDRVDGPLTPKYGGIGWTGWT